jgi:hypothetical protein
MRLDELKETVKKKGFGTSQYDNVDGDNVYLSSGVRTVFLDGDGRMSDIIDIIRRFQKKDYGSAAEHGKTERAGHEYGRYDIRGIEADGDGDCGVWIHRADDALIVYFAFER